MEGETVRLERPDAARDAASLFDATHGEGADPGQWTYMAYGPFESAGAMRSVKCDALNARSRRAATRLGFSFKGVFRQHAIVKGRNRDTAWFAMLDTDWPRIRENFEAVLYDPACQVSLATLNAPHVKPLPARG